MPAIKVPTNFNIDLDFEIPEFHRRLFAWAVDIVVQITYFVIARKIYITYLSFNAGDNAYEDSFWIISRVFLWPIIIYHIGCEIFMNGQSIGKKIFGLRVVNENGGRGSISQFLIRNLLRTTDLIFVIIILQMSGDTPLGLLIGAFLFIGDIVLVSSSKKGQRLGDLIAHTILNSTNPQGSMRDTVFLEVADNYVPSFPQIMQLNDKDINAIKSILDTARKKDDFTLAATASEKIKSHLKIDSQLSPFEFLEVLLKDYNYLSIK
jgi:uncharacterized RDD family membrane protein YckC